MSIDRWPAGGANDYHPSEPTLADVIRGGWNPAGDSRGCGYQEVSRIIRHFKVVFVARCISVRRCRFRGHDCTAGRRREMVVRGPATRLERIGVAFIRPG